MALYSLLIFLLVVALFIGVFALDANGQTSRTEREMEAMREWLRDVAQRQVAVETRLRQNDSDHARWMKHGERITKLEAATETNRNFLMLLMAVAVALITDKLRKLVLEKREN